MSEIIKTDINLLRKCRYCNNLFIAKRTNLWYCSKDCKKSKEREIAKELYHKNPEKSKENCMLWRKNNKERYKKYQREYISKRYLSDPAFRLKNKARVMSFGLVGESRCSFCSSSKDLEKHHIDYSKPKEIVTLCKTCHLALHKKERLNKK